MIARYSNSNMVKIFGEDYKFKKWLQVELAVCEAQAELGNMPQEAYDEIKKKATVKITELRKAEEKSRHEVVAFLNVLQDAVGEETARWIHFGLTSSDIMDTALALILKDAAVIIDAHFEELMSAIKTIATKHRYTPIMGRTHGVHAEPTSFGLKLAAWYDELNRDRTRFLTAMEQACVGKISGAVGNFANIDPEVEEIALRKLDIKAEPCASQIVHRDRHAEMICAMAITANSLAKFATEIRNLQRTEVGEVEEPFGASQQGSSAMPHKKNPIQCEQICGLARLFNGYAVTAFENIVLWHERDISHSSAERVIVADAFTLLEYMLAKMTNIINGMAVHADKMKENIELTHGLIFSQRLLLKLIRAGVPRQKAHTMIQGKIMSSSRKQEDFLSQVVRDGEIRRYLSLEEIQALFDLDVYIRYVDYIFKRVFPKKKPAATAK